MDESRLIRECLANRKGAYKELFRRYSGKMLALCRRYARHEMEAEDMLQDAFIKAFDNLKHFRATGSFEGWLRRITINTAIKYCQRKSFSKELTGYEHLPDAGQAAKAGDALSEEFLMYLIQSLPDGYRLVFNLYAIEGYSHEEIAAMLGISASTSRSQLVKARRMLQMRIHAAETPGKPHEKTKPAPPLGDDTPVKAP